MLLTLPTPAKSEFDFKSPHEFIHNPLSLPRPISPRSESSSSRELPLPPAGNHISNMSQPPPRIPPGSITLPDPRLPPPIGIQSHGGLPNPPSTWQGAEDSMRNSLVAKAEEDRRKQEEERTRQESLKLKQEEERTRQETLKLEQRKIEQTMLQNAIQHNVLPSLLPLILAGISGSGPNAASMDWLQQYAAQMAGQQQQQQAHSPDMRRGERVLGQPPAGQYAVQPPPLGQQPGAAQVPGFGSYQPGAGSPASATRSAGPGSAGPTSAPRGQFVSVLPRLATLETGQPPGQTHIQSSAVQSAQSEQASPGLYFHHWTPPSSQAGGSGPGGGSGSQNPAPSTPAGKRQI
jgi:hypothetical protein